MIIYWEIVPLILGFIIGALLYSKYQYRSGGIISIPLLGIYVIKFPLVFPIMIFVSLATYLLLQLLFTKFVIYGRRLLYVSLSVGMILMITLINLTNLDVGWYSLLIPGLIGYNSHREISSGKEVLVPGMFNVAYFIVVVVIAFATIYFI